MGTTECDAPNNLGNVFDLSPAGNGTWMYADLHDFQGGANDVAYPLSNLVIDADGNL